jgi:hypothetical protein
MLRELDGRLTRMQEVVGIETVDDFDVMPVFGECGGQSAHRNGIAAEAVGRIKGSEVKEVEGSCHADATFSITSIICWAA